MSDQYPGDQQPPDQQPDPSYGNQPYGNQPYGNQPYGNQGYPQQAYGSQGGPGYARDHPRSTTALVLGILGLVLCGLIAPFAWSIGGKTVKEIDASGGALTGRGSANAGRIMGIIGTVLLGIGIVVVIGFIVIVAVSGAASYSSS